MHMTCMYRGDFTDGRGNVDADSLDGNAPEAFNPEYESLPAQRPLEPPPYKATPGYGGITIMYC